MYEGIDTLVIHDELALEDSLPFVWQPITGPLTTAVLQRHADSNLHLLQACLALDDQITHDNPDEAIPQSAELARLDSKMNLVLDLLGRLLAQHQSYPAPSRIRFNARGAEWTMAAAQAAQTDTETCGVLEIYLRECLVDPLKLIGRVEQIAKGGRVAVRFDAQPDAVMNLLGKFIFRQHRRRVADARHPKRA